jgi:hypothetical protein
VIIVGRSDAQPGAAPLIPAFASAIIEGARSLSATAVRSFADLLLSLRADGFAILAGVDSAEVCTIEATARDEHHAPPETPCDSEKRDTRPGGCTLAAACSPRSCDHPIAHHGKETGELC